MFIKHGTSGINVRAPQPADCDFVLTAAQRDDVVVAGSTSLRSVQDVTYSDHTAATTDSAYDLLLQEKVVGSLDHGGSWYVSNPAVAQLDEVKGRITRVADGNVTIAYDTVWLSRGLNLSFARSGGQTTSTINNFASGSLLNHLVNQIDPLLTGDPATGKPIYQGDPTSRPNPFVITRNPSFWGSAVDFSCFSPWMNGYGNQMGGTLITPRHLYFNAHYSPTVDGGVHYPTYPIYFVAQDGEVIQRTVTNMVYYDATADIAIAVLDSDVPAKIKPAKVWPTTLSNYFGSWFTNYQTLIRFPVVGCDQEKKAHIRDMAYYTSGVSAVNCTYPADTLRKTWYEDVITGDSSSPCFSIVNGQLVLWGGWHFGGAGAFSNMTNGATRSAIATALGSYSLSVVDLTSFPTY